MAVGQLSAKYLAAKARLVHLNAMQKLRQECDCSSWAYRNIYDKKGAVEQHWKELACWFWVHELVEPWI